jgi:hypothetical protein
MSSLRASLDQLAEQFTSGVLQVIRTANLEDLLTESGGSRRSPGRPTGRSAPKRGKGGRLGRRTPGQIAEVLAKVVSAISEGIKAKKLRSKGQKRSTTYFVR